MKNLTVKIIVNCIMAFAVLYLLFAFIATDIDAKAWPKDSRSLLVMLWVMLLCVVIPVTVYNYKEEHEDSKD